MVKLRMLYLLVLCRLREFRREPSAIFFVVFFPLVVMGAMYLIFDYHTEQEAEQIVSSSSHISTAKAAKIQGSLGVVGLKGEHGAGLAGSLQDMLSHDFQGYAAQGYVAQGYDLDIRYGSMKELKEFLHEGVLDMILEIVAKDGEITGVHYWMKGMKENGHQDAAGSVLALDVHSLLQSSIHQHPPLAAKVHYLQPPKERYLDFLLPGFLAFSIFTTCLFGLGMTMVVNRREQLLKRYVSTPMPRFFYILSHLLGRQMIMLLEIGVILGSAVVLFSFALKGSFWLFLALCSLGTFMMSFLAVMLSSRTSQASFYNGLANFLLLPMMLLSEVWFPIVDPPEWLAFASKYSPLTPLVSGLREVALEGATLVDVTSQIVIMAGYMVVFALLGHRLFVWYAR